MDLLITAETLMWCYYLQNVFGIQIAVTIELHFPLFLKCIDYKKTQCFTDLEIKYFNSVY